MFPHSNACKDELLSVGRSDPKMSCGELGPLEMCSASKENPVCWVVALKSQGAGRNHLSGRSFDKLKSASPKPLKMALFRILLLTCFTSSTQAFFSTPSIVMVRCYDRAGDDG